MNLKNTAGRSRRRGVTILECVAAMGILVVGIGTVTTWTHRIGRVWRDVADQRVASAELSSQMQSWTRLPVEEVNGAVDQWTASDSTRRALPNVQLSGEVIRDALGDRLRLRLSWKTVSGKREAELIGWFTGGDLTGGDLVYPVEASETSQSSGAADDEAS